MWWSFQRDQKFWCTASNLGDKKSIIKIICQRCGNVCVRLGPSLGDKWPKIMSGDKSSSDVTSRTGGWSPLVTRHWPAYVFTPGPPAIYLRHRKHSKDQTNTSSMLLTLFFHCGKRKVHFLFFFPCPSVVCQMFCPPIVDTVFRLLMTRCPQNTSVNVIDLNSARILSSSPHRDQFSRVATLCWQSSQCSVDIGHQPAHHH